MSTAEPTILELPPPIVSRRAKRLRPPMHCYWGTTEACPRTGKITSLGVDGCFVQTKAETQEGQTVFVNCWLPTGRWMLMRGRVNYRLPKIGFSITFVEQAENEREMLSMLLEFFID